MPDAMTPAIGDATAEPPEPSAARSRAARMPADERREMIANAAIPLFIEHGASITTRELADALDIAEGTIFRAFGDKEALIHAVVDAFFAQAQRTLTNGLGDPSLELAEKLRLTIHNARIHAKGVFAMIALLDPSEARQYMIPRREGHFEEAAAAAFAADADAINIPPARMDALVRLLVIAASSPHMGAGEPLTDDELVDFALYGLTGRPATDASVGATAVHSTNATNDDISTGSARRKD